jgi:hypothetical protein
VFPEQRFVRWPASSGGETGHGHLDATEGSFEVRVGLYQEWR